MNVRQGIAISLAWLLVSPPAGMAGEPRDPTGIVTLEQAVALAVAHHPDVRAAAFALRAAEARGETAAALPNPELEAEVEDVGGSGPRRRFDDAQTTVLLAQRIELGGKRARRREVAARARDLAAVRLAASRGEAAARARQAFVATVVAQERLRVARELVSVAREEGRELERQLRAGATSRAEVTRAALGAAQAEVLAAAREADLGAARVALAATWGSVAPRFERAEGHVERLHDDLAPEALAARLADGPEVARLRAERLRRASLVALERARRMPDVTIAAGPRYYSESETGAVVFGLSLPLPLFDRNQGAAREARARLGQARADEAAALVVAHAALDEHLGAAQVSGSEARALHHAIIPQAEEVERGMRRAFAEGAVRSLDVLEARRTLYELRDRYWVALGEHHAAVAEVERITASVMPSDAEATQ